MSFTPAKGKEPPAWFTERLEKVDENNWKDLSFLTRAYREGKFVKRDINKTLFYLNKMLKMKDGEMKHVIQQQIADIYLTKDYSVYDPTIGFEWMEKSANGQNHHAMFKIGTFYYEGKHVEKNQEMALEWYKRLSDADGIGGSLFLAEHYLLGKDGIVDRDLGIKYFNRIPDISSKKDVDKATWVLRARVYEEVLNDEAKAIQAYSHLAKSYLDTLSHLKLGLAYYEGTGVEVDLDKAAGYCNKARRLEYAKDAFTCLERISNGGGSVASHLLGDYYLRRKTPDPERALALYQKSHKQGSKGAASAIAMLYQNEKYELFDLDKAYAIYSDNYPADYVSEGILEKICKRDRDITDNKTTLFGVVLSCASRDLLMDAIKLAGASVEKEGKNYWNDVYATSNVLSGTSSLNVLYTRNNEFAEAVYTFPSNMNVKQTGEIQKLIASKYGKPDKMVGNENMGDVKFSWLMSDGIEINVYREWPQTTTYLSYSHPKKLAKVREQQAKEKLIRDKKKRESQNSAF
tara:strand:+ start:76 stop:1629 length:1554 start_codon:yes stop_codon:yes gene_type:complete